MSNSKSWERKSLYEAINAVVKQNLYNTHTAMPVKVLEVESTSEAKVTVQPLVRMKIRNRDEEDSLPSIPSVPVAHLNSNGGNTFISLPIKAGDLGYIIFMENSIQRYVYSSNEELVDSGSYNRFNLTDAVFVPAVRPFNNRLTGISADDIVIKNKDLVMEIDPDGELAITGKDSVELVSELETFADKVKTLNTQVTTLTDNLFATYTLEAAYNSAFIDDAQFALMGNSAKVAFTAYATGVTGSLLPNLTSISSALSALATELATIKTNIGKLVK